MKPSLLSLFLVTTSLVQGATVHFTITLGDMVPNFADLTAGQVIHGSVSYDPTDVPLIGLSTLTPVTDPTMTVNLTFAGFNYGVLDDSAHPSFPQFAFLDGEIRAISYWAENKHPDSSGDGFLQIEGNPEQLFTYSFDGDVEYFGTVTWPYQVIPEPRFTLLFATASLLLLRRQRISRQ